jgi:nitrous oxidase accessory protein
MLLAAAWMGLAAQAAQIPAPRREIVVDPRGPVATLTQAIAAARPGDRITVHAGVYREPEIIVDKPVTILGVDAPVFDGQGTHQVITVKADSVTIRGLVIRNVGASGTEDRAGIKVVERTGCDLEDNVLLDTYFGIYLSKSTDCTVRHNRFRGSGTTESLSGNAIHSWSSSRLVIEDNDIAGHRDGIYFEFTTGARVRHNRSRHNLRYGLHFMFSNDCEYSDNTFEENGAGVAVMYSGKVIMRGNRFALNQGPAAFGLLLKDITDSRIENNVFMGNSVGLHAEGTTRVVVLGNDFQRNGWAARVMGDAVDNQFHFNRFLGNSFDVATNSAHASTDFTSNYWDRYEGYDLNRDGYGDVPFAPVRLFALVVQQHPPAIILLQSFLTNLLDLAERAFPVLTPPAMADSRPLMTWPVPGRTEAGRQ